MSYWNEIRNNYIREDVIFVNYRDCIAKNDDYAQEIINDTKQKLIEAIKL